jgi:hypothetical protein
MIDFESDTPFFYWTFSRLGDLEQGQVRYGFDGSVWKADPISSYSIGEADLTFESPAKWTEDSPSVTLHRNVQGHYEFRSRGVVYVAVRAETLTHLVMTGEWSETDSGSGMFIAVFPFKQDVKALLETAATVPVEIGISELVPQP